MKDKGFTLIELLGVIILIAALMLLVYPNVLEKVQEKENDVIEKKRQLVYTAAYDYLYENKGGCPVRSGKTYLVSMERLVSIDKLPIDEYEDILKDSNLSNNYIQIKIGSSNNAYNIVTTSPSTTCASGIGEG